jgi:hypothetical protein
MLASLNIAVEIESFDMLGLDCEHALPLLEALAEHNEGADRLAAWLVGKPHLLAEGGWPMKNVLSICSRIPVAIGDRAVRSQLADHVLARVHSTSFQKTEREAAMKALARLRAGGAKIDAVKFLDTEDPEQRIRVLDVLAELKVDMDRQSLDQLSQHLLAENIKIIPAELRQELCTLWMKDACIWGKRCFFAHGTNESLLTHILKRQEPSAQRNQSVDAVTHRISAYLLQVLKTQSSIGGPAQLVLQLLQKSSSRDETGKETAARAAGKQMEVGLDELCEPEQRELDYVVIGTGARASGRSKNPEQPTLMRRLEARLAKTFTSFESPALHDPGGGPAPYMCAKLWHSSQLVEQIPLPTAAANEAKTAYPLVCFLVDREDLEDGARNNSQFEQQVMELVQSKTLGRMLFSAILHCIRAQFNKNPVAAADRLQTLAELIGTWEAERVEEQLERQLLLKELRIGRRDMELPVWSGEVSVPQWRDKGDVSMRLLLHGNEQVVAKVSVVKADLSEHKRLLEVPKELLRFKEHLRELRVRSWALKALPKWLGELRNLQKLSLSSCSGLTALPESMASLTKLQELDLSECSGLSLHEWLGEMKNLQKLDLYSCIRLTTLPESLSRLTGLKKLDLEKCQGLTALPESMGRLTGLQELTLVSCSGLKALPESMGSMTGLLELKLPWCSGLTALPESMGRLTGLQKLDLSSCSGLKTLPESMGGLTELQELDLSCCPSLKTLPVVKDLGSSGVTVVFD